MYRHIFDGETTDIEPLKLLRHRRFKPVVLTKILELLDLTSDGLFKLDTRLEQATLGPFIDFVEKHKVVLETVFEQPLRRDLSTDAVRSLNQLLAQAGLRLIKKNTTAPNKVKRYIYGWDANTIAFMDKVVAKRQSGIEASKKIALELDGIKLGDDWGRDDESRSDFLQSFG